MATDTQSASVAPHVETTALRRLVRDLRSPLASVVSYLDLVLEGGAGPMSAEQREFVAVAARNAYAMLNMLDVDHVASALGVEVSRTARNGITGSSSQLRAPGC